MQPGVASLYGRTNLESVVAHIQEADKRRTVVGAVVFQNQWWRAIMAGQDWCWYRSVRRRGRKEVDLKRGLDAPTELAVASLYGWTNLFFVFFVPSRTSGKALSVI